MTALGGPELVMLAYAGIFLGALLAFEGLRQALSRTESTSEIRNRRMRMIAKGATTEQLLALLKPNRDAWSMSRIPGVGSLPASLRLAGSTMSPWVFVGGCILVATLVGAVGSRFVGVYVASAIGLLLGFGLPVQIVKTAGDRRKDSLVRQLPDALDLMARGLKVGHPLNTTIATVASDMSDPIASEFGVMVDQISYGDDLVNAFNDLADRLDIEDVRYLSVSVAIQHGTGGNLAQVMGTLSKVIRDRITLRKRIQAISSEGRLTSIFLSLLPLAILGATSITSPDYYIGVMDDPLFRPFAITVAGLTIVNFLAMRRLVKFRI